MVFTKPATPGRVKTRLVGRLTASEAAALHRAFLGDLMEELGGAAEWTTMVAWALEEGEAVPSLSEVLGEHPEEPAAPDAGVDGFAQRGEDLGARLAHGLGIAARRGHDPVLAVGSDHPELPADRVRRAVALLNEPRGADAVFGPASDGGYYLVGLRAATLDAALFEGIAWSTAGVLDQSLERCAALGCRVALLETGHDVDTLDELEELAARLASEKGSESTACRRTRAALRRLGLGIDGARVAAGGA